jgi:hypothetical protein
MMHRVARLLLGSVFAAAGIAKILAFSSFQFSLAALAGVTGNTAEAMACCVIAAELVVGLSLLAGIKTRPAALAAGFMLVVFAVVLTVGLLRGITLPCRCFGGLGPGWKPPLQISLDLLLFLLSFVAAGRMDGVPGSRPPSRRRKGAKIAVGMIVALWSAVVLAIPSPNETFAAGGAGVPSAIVKYMAENPLPVSQGRVLLLTDFLNFGCQLCLEDFLALCDSLNAHSSGGNWDSRLIIRADPRRSPAVQNRLLEGWLRGNGYTLRAELDRDSLFEKSGVKTTSVLAFDDAGRLLIDAPFPLGEERRRELLDALRR